MKTRRAPADTAVPLVLAGELRIVLSKLSRRLREQAHAKDLTGSQKSVLMRLERDGPATVTTLARAEGVRPQSTGATVSTLQTAGLVAGSPDPADGRQTILSLTAACRKMIKISRARRDDWLSHALQTRLTVAEQNELANAVGLLDRIANS